MIAIATRALAVDLVLVSLRLDFVAIIRGRGAVDAVRRASERLPGALARLAASLQDAWSRTPLVVEAVLALVGQLGALIRAAFTPVGDPFALIRDSFALLGGSIAFVGDPVAFVGDPVAFVGRPLLLG